MRKIAVRYSEAEPIAMTEAQQGFVDWVWIDTNTKLPLDEETVLKLAPFKTCLVSPCRWGRPDDIPAYIAEIEKLGFPLTAVMTELQYAPLWQKINSA